MAGGAEGLREHECCCRRWTNLEEPFRDLISIMQLNHVFTDLLGALTTYLLNISLSKYFTQNTYAVVTMVSITGKNLFAH